MEHSAKDIENITGISVDRQRIRLKSLFPEQSFDKYEVLNGRTAPMLKSFLESNRTAKKEKASIRKLLKQVDTSAVIQKSKKQEVRSQKNWRNILAVLPLPMLGLAASYGVYYFASQFAPAAVAVIEATAFELTYIGLAMQTGLTDEQQKRANRISIFAMVVSVIYNIATGLFHQYPAILESNSLLLKIVLSTLHGLPIPALAWAVADLLLHRN